MVKYVGVGYVWFDGDCDCDLFMFGSTVIVIVLCFVDFFSVPTTAQTTGQNLVTYCTIPSRAFPFFSCWNSVEKLLVLGGKTTTRTTTTTTTTTTTRRFCSCFFVRFVVSLVGVSSLLTAKD